MNIRQLAFGAALAAASIVPALAQSNPAPVPSNNSTVSGTEGPNSNSAGYPSATTAAGDLNTVNVGPQVTAAPAR